jgi:hypothetical protein
LIEKPRQPVNVFAPSASHLRGTFINLDYAGRYGTLQPFIAQRLRKENDAVRQEQRFHPTHRVGHQEKEFLCTLATFRLASMVEVAPRDYRDRNGGKILELATLP